MTTVQDCRTILKVHIMAAESMGKIHEAMAILAVLVAVDERRACDSSGETGGQAQSTGG